MLAGILQIEMSESLISIKLGHSPDANLFYHQYLKMLNAELPSYFDSLLESFSSKEIIRCELQEEVRNGVSVKRLTMKKEDIAAMFETEIRTALLEGFTDFSYFHFHQKRIIFAWILSNLIFEDYVPLTSAFNYYSRAKLEYIGLLKNISVEHDAVGIRSQAALEKEGDVLSQYYVLSASKRKFEKEQDWNTLLQFYSLAEVPPSELLAKIRLANTCTWSKSNESFKNSLFQRIYDEYQQGWE